MLKGSKETVFPVLVTPPSCVAGANGLSCCSLKNTQETLLLMPSAIFSEILFKRTTSFPIREPKQQIFDSDFD